MPEIYKERMVIVWKTDGENVGQFQGAHLDELIRYEDGSTRNTQRPLSEKDADDLLGQVESQSLAKLQSVCNEADSLRKQVEELNAEREELLEQLKPMHNPRMIDPRKWYARLTSEEVLAVASIDGDENLKAILENLRGAMALKDEDSSYQMSMDHPNTISGIGYLVAIKILSEDRAAHMLSDSTPEEA